MNELKRTLSEFTEIFSNSLCIICVILSGFLIFINVYHYKEIRYDIRNDYLLEDRLKEDIEKINKMKKDIASVKDISVSQSNYLAFSQIKIQLNKGLDALLESSFYTMTNDRITLYDLYEYNNELFSTIQYKCLFEVDYVIKNNSTKVNYDIEANVDRVRNNILINSDYLRNQLLANSNYYYSTENSKITIYNQTLNYYKFTVNNYDNILSQMEELTNWFVDEFGR